MALQVQFGVSERRACRVLDQPRSTQRLGAAVPSDDELALRAFLRLIRTRHLVGSMGTVGDRYDNAPMESFWGSMQIELLNRKKWRTKIELSIAIAEWIEHFYNPERLHSFLGYLPPVEFETLHAQSVQA